MSSSKMKYVCEKDHCKWAVLDETGKKGICSIRNCPYLQVKKYSYGKKIWTPEMVKDLKQMYNNGKGIEAIAAQLGISYYFVNNKISELIKSGELSKRDRATFWTDERDALLKDMYKRGYTQVNMAKALGKSKGTINNRIVKLRAMGKLDE